MPKTFIAACLCFAVGGGIGMTDVHGNGPLADSVLAVTVFAFVLSPWCYIFDALRLGLVWDELGVAADRASAPFYYWFMIVVFALMGVVLAVMTYPFVASSLWP